MLKWDGVIFKRKSTILFAIILIGLLPACSFSGDDKTNEVEKTSSYFKGTIKKINGNNALVSAKIFEGNPESDVFVDLSVNSDKNFQVGDKIKVEFDGNILESNPAQINTLSVELIE
ncbi:hypothetical protein GCM10007063_30790 [Lentibacillus kapialis]|uniref:DUF3221 domain-containing protein n=1 Tax=Lentibacillus kapialis TaxID=340214 RepID=A0A917Q1R0_9BACI|nr:DUF3221 domain-containing protein [Lentibacillus kapialis]GGK06144.1 hypothetical protein GCM10007063_30790 [Lentibacillus kapialis]